MFSTSPWELNSQGFGMSNVNFLSIRAETSVRHRRNNSTATLSGGCINLSAHVSEIKLILWVNQLHPVQHIPPRTQQFEHGGLTRALVLESQDLLCLKFLKPLRLMKSWFIY